ncbi:hypothetical protein [Phenylobacterium sp. SCN 70-31]|uniref:hypothetical protein n=1 Tax=Phenylobacterium sp. SCN 70-31 TaxID=1660129 RepID=UPI00086E7C3E|nr:hypothetical protein [Phenylobacterium sp. SCN 70-31]ODT88059.1 MAG: hypothetical protein ABS78_09160 [Phenylobacterium sp. SCN 70-31]
MPARTAVIVLAALTLAACSRSAETPASPVVATVGSEPITLAEVQSVQPGATSGAVDPAVLGRLINRRLLAQAATADKLDQTPAFGSEIERGSLITRADLKIRALSESVAEPTAQEIDAFIADRPQAFARRKFIVLEQITTPRPKEPLDLKGESVTGLDQIQARLEAAGLPAQRQVVVVDSANTPPAAVARITGLPAGAVFEMTSPSTVTEARVLQVVDAPLTGAAARAAATASLKAQRAADAVAKATETLRIEAVDRIKFEPGYSATY